MTKQLKLEWYVLNETHTSKFDEFPYARGPIKPWNIFNNCKVYEETISLCKRHEKKQLSFEDFVEELRKIIMWQEWTRCEYEIVVGTLFEKDNTNYQKIDAYQQVLPNIKILAKYVLDTYYSK